MNKLEVVMYHYVRDLSNSRYPDIKGLDIRFFMQQLDFFEKNGYSFVGIQDVLDAIYEKKRLPKNAIMLSFDDGYIDHFTNVYPILYNKGIPGLFAMPGKIIRERKALDVNKIHFILASTSIDVVKNSLFGKLDYCRSIGFGIASNDELYEKYAIENRFDTADTIFVKRILQNAIPEEARNLIVEELFHEYVTDNEKTFVSELYMNLEQMKTMMKNGMSFALHGYEHYWFDCVSKDTYSRDINNALDVFEGIIDKNNWFFCYPYGASSDELINYCKSIGCTAGLTVEPKIADLDSINPYSIPRFDTNDYPPKVEIPRSRQ